MQTFRANGKLLLTGEYFVLDGAKALAVPTKKGQVLNVSQTSTDFLHWQSLTVNGEVWFECKMDVRGFQTLETTDEEVSNRLILMLKNAQSQNPEFLMQNGWNVSTQLEFPRDWGLGSSSTLVCLIAKWANANAFEILFNSMKGSGYDIACGMTDSPLLYQLVDGKPEVEAINYHPPFSEQLYFVHLGKKQNSREGIQRYRTKAKYQHIPLSEISDLTKHLLTALNISYFNQIVKKHELLVAQTVELPRAKNLYFEDYNEGEIKSLGAWGGDFILVSSTETKINTISYFYEKGFSICIPYDDMVL